MSEIDPNLLCPRCMNVKTSPGEVCPVCGCDPAHLESDPHCLPPMTVLDGRYLVGCVLGEGGFGITYVACDLSSGRKLAVKEYYPSSLAARDTSGRDYASNLTVRSFTGDKRDVYQSGLAKFRLEAQTLMRLNNLDGIVSILDYFPANNTAYIVMEYVEGVTLRDYLRSRGGRLTEQEALAMLRPLIVSLGEVHRTGLVHRDISPDNIMVGPDGSVKLIDFGAARSASSDENRTMTVILKHGYAPEEQYRSHGRHCHICGGERYVLTT